MFKKILRVDEESCATYNEAEYYFAFYEKSKSIYN
jgi:hypothetical protein